MRRRTGAAGTLIAFLALVPLAEPAHAQDVDCSNFAYQEDAQAVFDADRSDPHRLDEDPGPDDNIACEALPRRSDALTSSTYAPRRPTTPAPAVPTATAAPTTAAPTPPAPTPTPTRGVRGGLGGASDSGPSAREVGVGAIFVAGALFTTAYLVKRRRRS
ncbi:excalibur calcium-binding protein [Streptomyces sp. NPDC001595]|uniref:excalibur calcium-binding protein n=1 Tax=Streptomyces sp. NPDC001532 TaxID=3154520 RepID=UPI00332D9DE7